jgi:error-prone DNA polymerase
MNYEMYFITVYDIVRFARATRKAGVVAQLPILPCFCSRSQPWIRPSNLRLSVSSAENAANHPTDIDVDFEHQRARGGLSILPPPWP